jgi:hypothetical protein
MGTSRTQTFVRAVVPSLVAVWLLLGTPGTAGAACPDGCLAPIGVALGQTLRLSVVATPPTPVSRRWGSWTRMGSQLGHPSRPLPS